MKKRLAAALTLLLAVGLTLCGCAKRQLTAEEYSEELKNCWSEFLTATMDWTKYAPEKYPYSDSDIKEMKKVISRREKALDGFKKLDPPTEYSALQYDLEQSLGYEYEWNKAALKLAEAKDKQEADKFGEEIASTVSSIPEGKSLPEVYLTITKELRQ